MKKEVKSEKQIREEVRAEFERENEIKEKARQELLEEQKRAELAELRGRNAKRGVGRVILSIIFIAVFLFVLFETVMGVLDMQRLNNDEEPVWYIDSNTEVVEEKTITKYNLGLYTINKVVDSQGTKIILKPFFL